MLTVAIHSKDKYFTIGLSHAIEEVAQDVFGKIRITDRLDSSCSILFIDQDRCSQLLCKEEIKIDNTKTDIVVITNTSRKRKFNPFPECFGYATILSRQYSVNAFKQAIRKLLEEERTKPKRLCNNCLSCVNKITLTPTQRKVAQGLQKGKDFYTIADELGIDYKHVMKQKDIIISQFKIKNRLELVQLIDIILKKQENQ